MNKTVIILASFIFLLSIALAAENDKVKKDPTKEKEKTAEPEPEEILEHYNILALDGGGVRGLIAV